MILKVFDGIGDVFLLKLRPQAQPSDLRHLLSQYIRQVQQPIEYPTTAAFLTIKE